MNKTINRLLYLPLILIIVFSLSLYVIQYKTVEKELSIGIDGIYKYLFEINKHHLKSEVCKLADYLADYNKMDEKTKSSILKKINYFNDDSEDYLFVYKVYDNISKAKAIIIPDLGIRKIGTELDLNKDKNLIWKNLVTELIEIPSHSMFKEYKFINKDNGIAESKLGYFYFDMNNNLLIGKALYLSSLNHIINNFERYEQEQLNNIMLYSIIGLAIFILLILSIIYILSEKIKTTIINYESQLEYDNRFLEERVKHQTEDIFRKYYYCNLTGLPNRNKLLEDIKNIKSIIIIDIDDFGSVNDIYGTEFGNYVLREVANFLDLYLMDGIVYRIGSDEFAIAYSKDVNLKSKIIELQHAFVFLVIKKMDLELDISISMGASDKPLILETADMALRYSKKIKQPFVIYNSELNLKNIESNILDTIKMVKDAIRDDRIVPFFQCIKNRDLEIVKYESLIRLIKEDGKVVSPYFFLEISKKAKLYFELTYIMLEKTFKEFESRDELVSINLSYQDIVNPVARVKILNLIQNYSNSQNLVVELLETEDLENLDEVVSFLDTLRKEGCKIAIDDFGSGYSNFSYLLKLNPDYIKIDGSITKHIAEDENARLIFKTIVDFVHKKDIKITAEFIFNGETYKKARELGADEYQGYYFCEPQQIV